MKFVHIADTHLGATQYRKISESGYNQREEDVASSFRWAIDKILEIKPDFVLHAGDLFDSARPTNRMIHFALEQVLRIVNAKIPFIMISGNHDTPKQRFTGSVFKIFEVLAIPNLHVVYKNEYSRIEIGGALIHAIPQCTEDGIFREQLKRVKKAEGKKNILMLHAGVTGMRAFSHGDFNELLIDSAYFDEHDLDYVALGHYHNCVEVGRNAWFSGSTERLSFNEAGNEKGFLNVDITDKAKVNMVETPTREMKELKTINAFGKDSLTLSEEIEKALSSIDPTGKLIRIKIEKVSTHVLSTLDVKKFKEMMAKATHFEPIFEKVDEKGRVEQIKVSIGGVREEFNLFIDSYESLTKEEKERFKSLGQKYLNLASEEEKE